MELWAKIKGGPIQVRNVFECSLPHSSTIEARFKLVKVICWFDKNKVKVMRAPQKDLLLAFVFFFPQAVVAGRGKGFFGVMFLAFFTSSGVAFHKIDKMQGLSVRT